jgi:uncharacterized protein
MRPGTGPAGRGTPPRSAPALPALVVSALVLLSGTGCGPGPRELPGEEGRVRVLFLGDDGHHRPWERARAVLPVLAERGVDLFYTDDPEELTAEVLGRYHVLLVYGNQSRISDERLLDLLEFLRSGGGLVAVHSASASFPGSEAFIRLVGGAFKSHGVGTFSTVTVEPDHPAVRGIPDFESWDETYVHQKHNPNRTVLSVRRHEGGEEPWTWVRDHGEGRVFYTAWGHDLRTWSNPGFQRLVERGIRWAAGDWALEAPPPPLPEPTRSALPAPLPAYPAGEPWGTTGEPITEAEDPFDPEDSRRLIVLPPGFRAELFAAEPDVVNPIDIAWDERGRAWVLETVDYPNNLHEDRRGSDRLLIMEDTNGDGRADRITVFADDLNVPTGLVLHRDGAIVAQAPDMLFLRDTTGDGRADVREVLFTGWQTFDTHAGPSNLRYGLDNWIWGAVGYAGFRGTVGGQEHDFAQGFYRFAPDGSALERLASTSNNTWGLGMDEEGHVFGSTANREPSVFLHIPDRYYRSVAGWGPSILPLAADRREIFPLRDDIRQVDQHGMYTAGAGHEIYTARSFPPEFWNRVAFVAEPTGHLLGRFHLERRGSAFLARNRWSFLASRDAWTAPIAGRVGPDGMLWVLDWYNLVIQHNPTPEGMDRGPGNAYESPNRDRAHGRIYRIVHEDAPRAEPVRLDRASPAEWVAALRHPNLFWRLTAQRLLVEGGHTEVQDRLLALLRDQILDEIGLAPGPLHALWTLQGLGLVRSDPGVGAAVVGALQHPAAAVRRSAVQLLPRDRTLFPTLVAAGIIPGEVRVEEGGYAVPAALRMDADPHVRLAALLALSEAPASQEAGRSVAELLLVPENAGDPWIPDAAAIAGARHHAGFLPALREGMRGLAADSELGESLGRVAEIVDRHAAEAPG